MIKLKKIVQSIRLRIKIIRYNLRKKRILCDIKNKPKIRVVFFVLYDNMWKSDGLFKLLLSSNRFEPFIVSSPYPHHPREFRYNNQLRIEKVFKEKGFPYYNGYDFSKEQWFDIKSLRPDIIFYQQPYNTGYKGFKIESLWKNCLFGYIPYTYELEESSALVNGLLMNIAWRVFLPSDYEVKRQSEILINRGNNLVATGSLLADCLIDPNVGLQGISWKQKDNSIKRVIWAPHHSILESDFLHYSNFLEISDKMLDLAAAYQNRIQFVFKPHPVLKRKLYKVDGWGQKKTDDYYSKWANLPNANIVEGEYVDLFKTSDAMIHDCSTFTAEYLFTKKPVMFITKQKQKPVFNDFGNSCLNLHYLGSSIEDIDYFLNHVVLQGEDKKKPERESFFENTLMIRDEKNTACRMYDVFCSEFK